MSEEEENLAIALLLKGEHGAAAPRQIAEQLGTVALRADAARVARWQAIAAALDNLQRETRQ